MTKLNFKKFQKKKKFWKFFQKFFFQKIKKIYIIPFCVFLCCVVSCHMVLCRVVSYGVVSYHIDWTVYRQGTIKKVFINMVSAVMLSVKTTFWKNIKKIWWPSHVCHWDAKYEQASLVQALLDLHDKTQSLLLLTELVEYSTWF